jgi:serine/threonine protein kinase/Flp pilus assembly protein TadD
MAGPSSEQSIFLHAIELPSPGDRAAYLDEVCRDNPGLRAELDALLAAHGRLGGDLFPITGQQLPDAACDAAEQATQGNGAEAIESIVSGRYKLLQQIGEGGMGTVFMAEQTHPVQRKVALKIIKPGMDSRQVIARFEAERQALALMDHPNIAKVLDAGTVGGARDQGRGASEGAPDFLATSPSSLVPASGRPYFVMELVKGVPITRYSDEHRLTPKQRLELFLPVCQAIQHAHQKGIIHRDLKPSNVLVAEYDDKPVAKVIDFGVAKATGPRLTERTMFTEFGQVVGTLEYMSPEQAKLNALDIDTRSDIYALGVLLYELLTGTTPFEKKRLHEAAFYEMLRIIREEEPPTPSTRLSTTAKLPSIAANRGLEAEKLSGLVRGELDWIVMKCLEKDRNRRYETASGLARDVERYLHDEPVQACPPSASYRLRKFARRNKAVLTTAALVVAALLLGTGISVWQAIAATLARDAEMAARIELSAAKQLAEARAEKISRDLEQMNAANALLDSGRFNYLVVVRWAQAERDFTKAVETRPESSAVWFERGTLYARLGLWDLAIADFAKSFERQEPVVTEQWYYHALLRLHAGDTDGYQQICQRMEKRFGASTDWWACNCLALACVLSAEAGVDRGKVVQAAQQALTLPGSYSNWGLTILGTAHYRASQYEQAVQRLSDSQQIHPGYIVGHRSILAMAQHSLGRTDLAQQELRLAEQALDARNEAIFQAQPGVLVTGAWWHIVHDQLLYREAKIRIEGKPPPEDARLLIVRGRAFAALGRDEQAMASFGEAIALKPAFAPAWTSRAFAYRRLGQWDKAIADHAQAIELAPQDAAAHNELAWLLATCPEPKFRDGKRAVELASKGTALAPKDGNFMNTLGAALYRAGECQAAITTLGRSMELRRGGDAFDWFFLAMAHHKLGQLDEARKSYKQAVAWMEKNAAGNEELRRFRAEAEEVLELNE